MALQAAFVTEQDLRALSDHGEHTCAFVNFISPYNNLAHICSATVVSQKQIIMNDSECFSQTNLRSPKMVLSCRGDLLRIPINTGLEFSRQDGRLLVNLPSHIDVAIPRLVKNRAERDEVLQHGRCELRGVASRIPMTNEQGQTLFSINDHRLQFPANERPNPRNEGGNLTCLNEHGTEIIVAIIDQDYQLKYLDELGELTSQVNREVDVVDAKDTFQEFQRSCNETETCFEQVSREAVHLSEMTLNVLNHYMVEFAETKIRARLLQNSTEDHNQLRQGMRSILGDLHMILAACQEMLINLMHREDSAMDSGALGGAQGHLENAFLGFSSLFSQSPIYDQFKNVAIISENIPEARIKEIIANVERTQPQLSNIKKIAEVAKILGGEVIGKFIDEMNIQSPYATRDEIIAEATADYEICLAGANNGGDITTCSDRLGRRSPALLARYELENQLEANFLDLFKNAQGEIDQEAYEKMKAEAFVTYQRCLMNYYYQNEERDATYADKARACVYEAVLAGYENASGHQIENNIAALISDPAERARQIRDIRQVGHQCSLGRLFHSSGSLTPAQYHTLSRLPTDDFERDLRRCTDGLTHEIGDVAVQLSVQAEPNFQAHIPVNEQANFLNRVREEYYQPCMATLAQHSSANPLHCETMITHLVTLDVAERVLMNTLDEQLASSTVGTPASRLQLKQQISSQVDQKITLCHSAIYERHGLALVNSQAQAPTEEDLNACLSDAIGDIAEGVASLKLQEAFESTPIVAAYQDQVMADERIQAVPQNVRRCFQDAVAAAGSVNEMASSVDEITERCTLQSTREATAISAELILEGELSGIILSAPERASFIDSYMNGDNGLVARIMATESEEEINQLIEGVTTEVAMRYAGQSIPALIEQYIGDLTTQERRAEIEAGLLGELETCVVSGEHTTDYCVNLATGSGYRTITGELIGHNITQHLGEGTQTSMRLQAESQARVNECIDALSMDSSNQAYTAEINQCVADEVLKVSIDVPKEAVLQFSVLMGSPLGQDNLRTRLDNAEQFYFGQGRLTPADAQDPALSTFMSLNTCLATARSEVNPSSGDSALLPVGRGNLNCNSSLRLRSGPSTSHIILTSIPCQTQGSATELSLLGTDSGWYQVSYQGHVGYVSSSYVQQHPTPPPAELAETQDSHPPAIDLMAVQEAYGDCTGNFESIIRGQVLSSFVNRSYRGKRNAHTEPLQLAGSILLELTGSEVGDSDEAAMRETKELLDLVGQQVVTSCNHDHAGCMRTLRESQQHIAQFKAANPDATSEQLQNAFIQSPFIALAVQAEVSNTLRAELVNALGDRFDNQGVLLSRIEHITSPQMMRQLMNNRYGVAATNYAREAISNGNADGLGSDPRLRSLLASAITSDLGNGTFVDELMYGLVQPTLVEQRGTFMTGIGTLLGMVKRQDFDWNRVRNTAYGVEAKRIFAMEILEPVFQGRDITRTPSSSNPVKSIQDDALERIEALIEEGVKALNR